MNFVSRDQWGARPPYGAYTSINSTCTTGHWEGPGMGSFPHDSCATKVRGIQAYHMDNNGWSDIAYNGVACPHGYVFEGRGPGHRSAANGTNASNDTSAVICYLGGEGDAFTPEGQQAMTDGANWLGDPMTKGHRDWYATACPGDVIYGWITSGASSGVAPGPGPVPQPPSGAAPPYPGTLLVNFTTNHGAATWQQQMANRGWTLTVDDLYGGKSEHVCRQFQSEKGLTVDGIVGPQTWEATWTAAIT